MTTEAAATEVTPPSPTPGFKRPAIEAAKLGEDIHGKVFVVTGCYSGIGVETTKALLAVGGKVVIGGRNKDLLEEFTAQMKKDYTEEQVDSCVIDLEDLESVQSFAKYVLANENYKDIIVICNAGVMNAPKGLLTKSGFDSQMGVNVVGHYLLCKILADVTARQVWVSSLGHKMVSCLLYQLDTLPLSQSIASRIH
jgi:NAD(P)-dependent dehydrogenase (short-subunit alcohol dehydrogenase family)